MVSARAISSMPSSAAAPTIRATRASGTSPSKGQPNATDTVTVAGYAEPSLVFLLGADTQLGDAQQAATAIAQGRPAIVEARLDGPFHAALAARAAAAVPSGQVAGLDYSKGRPDILRLYRPPPAPARGRHR